MKTLNHGFTMLFICILFGLMPLTACAPVSSNDNLPVIETTDLTGSPEEGMILLTLPQTMTGIQSVLAEAPGTFVLVTNHGNYLLGWPQGTSYAVVEVTKDGNFASSLIQTLRAEKVSPATLSDVVKRVGGDYIAPSAMMQQVMSALQGFLMWANAAMYDFVPILIILPGGSLPGDFPGLSPSVQG